MTTTTKTRYTCWNASSPATVGGCGSLHSSPRQAERCCRLHAQNYDEQREPVACTDRDEMFRNFPPSLAAAARDAERRARHGHTECRDEQRAAASGVKVGTEAVRAALEAGAVRPEDVPHAAKLAGEPAKALAVEVNALAADAAPEEPAKAPTPQPAPQPAPDHSDAPSDPWRPLAEGVWPHLQPRIAEDVTPGIAEALEAFRQEAGLDDEMRKKVDAAISKMDEKLAEIEAAKPQRIEVTTPDGESLGAAVEGAQHELFETLCRLVAGGENAFLVGPAGSGKTTAVRNLTRALGMEFFIQPVAGDKFDALGFVDAAGKYVPSEVYRWATHDGPAILLLDEIDAWSAAALVALNPLIDNGLGVFPNGTIEIDISKKRVISAANTYGMGASATYCGRNRLDGASTNRLGARLDWGYDESFERALIEARYGKEIAGKVVARSQKIRASLMRAGVQIVWSPRDTDGLAKRVAAGFTVEEALRFSGLAALPEDRRKAIAGA